MVDSSAADVGSTPFARTWRWSARTSVNAAHGFERFDARLQLAVVDAATPL